MDKSTSTATFSGRRKMRLIILIFLLTLYTNVYSNIIMNNDSLIEQMHNELSLLSEKKDRILFYKAILKYKEMGIVQNVMFDEVYKIQIAYEEKYGDDGFNDALLNNLDAIICYGVNSVCCIYSEHFIVPDWAKD
jgi:hypothetical protein